MTMRVLYPMAVAAAAAGRTGGTFPGRPDAGREDPAARLVVVRESRVLVANPVTDGPDRVSVARA
ncbi:hypothetical protein AB0368_36545 [Actinoplanes sp. NPDC051475]|uniref:hypothetical protein n=1 Tax=Actinoplanes sp. NPDC051475 TaxID=3157225 RepID=UPI00345097CE